jgi:hypothetical protein
MIEDEVVLTLIGCVSWTKSELFTKLIWTRTNLRASSAPFGRGSKNQKFSFLSFRFSAGGVGGADKKWKGNFWFCFAVSDYKMNISIIAFVVYSRCSFLRPHGETRRFLSALCGSLKLCGFDTGRGNSKIWIVLGTNKSVCAWPTLPFAHKTAVRKKRDGLLPWNSKLNFLIWNRVSSFTDLFYFIFLFQSI